MKVMIRGTFYIFLDSLYKELNEICSYLDILLETHYFWVHHCIDDQPSSIRKSMPCGTDTTKSANFNSKQSRPIVFFTNIVAFFP